MLWFICAFKLILLVMSGYQQLLSDVGGVSLPPTLRSTPAESLLPLRGWPAPSLKRDQGWRRKHWHIVVTTNSSSVWQRKHTKKKTKYNNKHYQVSTSLTCVDVYLPSGNIRSKGPDWTHSLLRYVAFLGLSNITV